MSFLNRMSFPDSSRRFFVSLAGTIDTFFCLLQLPAVSVYTFEKDGTARVRACCSARTDVPRWDIRSYVDVPG